MGIRIAVVALALLAGCTPAAEKPHAAPPPDVPAPAEPLLADPVPVPIHAQGNEEPVLDMRKAVSAAVRARLREIQACYETELKNNPGLTGKVVARFGIVGHGTVRFVHPEVESSTLAVPGVGQCIVAALRGVEFKGDIDEEATVSFPFVFSPRTD